MRASGSRVVGRESAGGSWVARGQTACSASVCRRPSPERLDTLSLTAGGTSARHPERFPAPAPPSQPPRRCTTCVVLGREPKAPAMSSSVGLHDTRLEMRGFEARVVARDAAQQLAQQLFFVGISHLFLPAAFCLLLSALCPVCPLSEKFCIVQSASAGRGSAATAQCRQGTRQSRPPLHTKGRSARRARRPPGSVPATAGSPAATARGLRARDRLCRVARDREWRLVLDLQLRRC